MTPAEKAKELIARFTHLGFVNWEAAKKDALICCEEILKLRMINVMGRGDLYDSSSEGEYWQKVKEEIKKL